MVFLVYSEVPTYLHMTEPCLALLIITLIGSRCKTPEARIRSWHCSHLIECRYKGEGIDKKGRGGRKKKKIAGEGSWV